MKEFRLIMAQIILLIALIMIVSATVGTVGLRSTGEASVAHDAAGQEIEVTEKEYYAYAQLNFPASWVVAAPALWLEHDNWQPELAYRRATIRVLQAFGVIFAVFAAGTIWSEFHQLKKVHTDATDQEAAELKARLPFNGRSMFYMIIFGTASYVVSVGWAIIILAILMVACEAVRCIVFYTRKDHVENHRKSVSEGESEEMAKTQSRKKKIQSRTDPSEPVLPPAGPTRPSRGHIYPVRPR